MLTDQYKLTAVDYDPFTGPEIERVIPLTASQKELFVSTLLGDAAASKAYNESFTLFLTGPFDENAFSEAFTEVQLKHESLRASISPNGETMVIFKAVLTPPAKEDISHLTATEQQLYIDKLVLNEAETIFDINHPPLLRAHLIKTGAEKHEFIFTAHHIIFDGWSMGILLQDLGKRYSAKVKKETLPLPEAFPFSSYATEISSFEQTEAYTLTKNFWLNQFKGWLPKFDFPTDNERPKQRTYNSRRLDFSVGKETVQALKTAGIKNECSLVTIFIAAFEVFLHKASGQKDIIFGLPAAGQSVTGHEQLIGHCVNMLPMLSHVDPTQSFTDYLKLRKTAILNSYDHQQISFGSLLKDLNIPRDASRIALVPVSFNVDLGMTNGVHFEGLSYQLQSNPRYYETFDFFLNLSGTDKEMVFEWSYNTNLFNEKTIRGLHLLFQQIITEIGSKPGILVKDLPGEVTVTDTEAYAALNNTNRAVPKEKTVDQLITEKARHHPEAIALRFEDVTLTYEKLERLANQAANFFIDNGITNGDIIGISINRSEYLAVFIIAAMKAGAIFQPVDPSYPSHRVNYILEDGGAKLLITDAVKRDAFTSNTTILTATEIINALPNYPEALPVVQRSADDLIYILHTSGTTGLPKGVMIRHRNVVNHLFGMLEQPGLQATDVLLSVTSISFDIFYLELFLPLITGASVVLLSSDKAKDTSEIVQHIRHNNITVVQTTPATWNSVLEIAAGEKLPVKIICGGEALSANLAARLVETANEVWNVYGPTEATIWASAIKINAGDEVITIGKPMVNTRFYILDENGKTVPGGKTGELYIAGDNVGAGYINKPELTAEKFLPDNIAGAAGDIMYRTGDLARLLENGNVQCLGRADEQIKVNGYRIEPQGIEQWIRNVSPNVSQVVVTAVVKNGISRLAAYYVADGDTMLPEEWKKCLKEYIPAYMIPQYYIPMKKLPLTPNGKIDKKNLPLPDDNYNNITNSAATTTAEILLQKVWARVLKIDNIGIDDDFFEAGGHSLVAVQIMQEILKETGKKLPLSTVFEYPTIRALATLLNDEDAAIPLQKSLIAIKPAGSKPPLYMVHGAGMQILLFYPLAKYLDDEQPLYGLQAKGMDGKDIKELSIEDIARSYNEEILASYSGTELSIVGYSMGGVIAYEMAKQLRQAGKIVKLTGMIDTYLDNEDYRHNTGKRYLLKAMRQPRKLMHLIKGLVSNNKETLQYQQFVFNRKVKKLLGNGNTEELADLTLAEKIDEHYTKAFTRYKLPPADDVIHLFKVNKRVYYVDDPRYLGWKPYAAKGLKLIDVPGDHKTFLLPPNDKIFAEKLQKILNGVDKNQ